ncbi:MAG TPA: glycosyltransferase family 4 protein, partial [Thermoanaerobaculia bacterium]|nr:glycosyltransferase family 4 protein [Thermoanaerobaculia bacterium]
EQNRFRQEWGATERFTLAYSGNLGRVHEFETLAGAAERLRGDSIQFLIIGGGPRLEELRSRLGAANLLDQVRFLPYQSRDDLAASLGAADVHLISLRRGLEGFVVPSKFYGVLAAGRPSIYIGSPEADLARLIEQHECGVVVRQGDAEALARVIRELRDDPARVRAMGDRARRAFEGRFTLRHAAEAWRAVLMDDSLPRQC